MADASTFGGGGLDTATPFGASFDSNATEGPGGAGFGGAGDAPADAGIKGSEAAPIAQPARAPGFGSGLSLGPHYTPPDPQTSALDQSADLLQQRINRANQISTNPLAQFFDPEGVQRARSFVPAATEQLQKMRAQRADMQANRQQASTLGLDPGDVPDEASQADRVEAAKARALKGDLRVFKGLQAVDPKAAEAIQDQVHEVVGSHLSKAQLAFDKLSNARNEGEYAATVRQLQQNGTLTDLQSLGLKVPQNFDAFNASKGAEGQALREARIGLDTVRQKLEDRNTYQPMEKKEAETYNGRLTTAYGDQITNGTWSRNGASNTRGLVINGAADPRDLGKTYTLATPEQRKAIEEEFKAAVPKEDLEKYRAFNRTYQMATTDAKGNPIGEGKINTNPNVQQGIAEALASTLRGGSGGANIGLLKLETGKRGVVQGVLDTIKTGYAGALNTISEKDIKPYLTNLTQSQIRDVLDYLHGYNDETMSDRAGRIAQRAGALGLDSSALGMGKQETAGAVNDAIEAGRQAQIERLMPYHQSIGGGDGVFQLGAQRPGAGATASPPGTQPTTQLPGAPPLATPVQQASASPPGGPAGGGAPPVAPNPPRSPGGATGGGSPAPMVIAGRQVSVPLPSGASASYIPNLQRIETGNEKDPWTAGTKGSSASGAFQFINSTWAANKPPGAPDRAGDATPAQQAQAVATLTAKNAQSLQSAGLPVNDRNLYIAHNVGFGGASGLLRAAPNADARTIVGEDAARNNPLFYKGKPTVATVLARYQAEMNGSLAPAATETAAQPQAPGLMTRISRMLSQGVPEDQRDKAVADVGNAAVQNAPAIGSTAGAVVGAAGGPAGSVAGGAAGGSAGQALKDYLQGNEQSPRKIAQEGALGGVLGVASAARPIAATAARVAGAGAVEAGAKAAEGGEAADVAEAGLKGAGAAVAGETFGRALGMVGHKVWNLFAPDAKQAVREAARKYSDAEATLATEAPKLPGAAGAASTVNPKYEAAEKARTEAETVLKDAGLKPEEAAYAHKVSSEGVPKQEAEVTQPGALKAKEIGAGYQQLENEVAATGKGAPKATPKLADGPIAAVDAGKVSKDHAELAQRVEAAITAPAPDWQTKWKQLKDARSELLEAQRDAMTSTAPGRSQTARDMRTLADAVRKQQEKAAKYVFGEKDGEAFMARLKVLDTRYRNLMEATNYGDVAKAAALKGEAGREAERKFMAFAHDDPQAQAAYRAMRGTKGDAYEKTVPWTVAAEGIPGVGKIVKAFKLGGMLREWARERTAGSPAKFADFVKTDAGAAAVNQTVRDLTGTAGARGATMGGQ